MAVTAYSDFRSDTVTKPTEAMRRAMAQAEVGDDVLEEDPTVRRLEETAAERLGMEAALFVPSGTMGNQIAAMLHARPGDEVIVEATAHAFLWETGGLARLAGLHVRAIPGRRGMLEPAAVEAAVRTPDVHHPRTSLLLLENTHNYAGGTIHPIDSMRRLVEVARRHRLSVHLDGARLMNACVASRTAPAEYGRLADSVMFCLSKGLAAPIGSLLVSTRGAILEARRLRKLLGGGMRQVGVIAAAGIVALETMVDRLAEDHRRARRLAEEIADRPGLEIDLESVQTNIVVFRVKRPGLDAAVVIERLRTEGVLASDNARDLVRLVTHKDVGDEDVGRAVAAIRRVL
jgi:threonine aldolase